MNILYLLFSFTTGGTERLVTDICNQMVIRQHTVHLYIVNDLYDESMLSGLDGKVQVHLQKRAPGSGKLKTLLAVARYIRKHRIQVVHCNSFDAPELLLLKPLYFPRTRVLHTIHDVGQYSSLGKLKCLYRNLLCHRLIVISQAVKQDLISHGADAKKVTTVYNAIDLTRFTPSAEDTGNAVPVIGNVARIMPEKKGQDLLVGAMALLRDEFPDLQCRFAGAADAAHEQAFMQLQQQVQKLALDDRVHFLGNVTDVPGFLRQLDVFVLPSRWEGFGISLVEAMAMGIPCVASRLDGPAEVLEDGALGTLFAPNDAQSLADALKQVLRELPACKSAARAKMHQVRQTYDITVMCDRLETLME